MAESPTKLLSRRRDARLEASATRGRLIVDDDGDLVFTEAAAAGPEPFLEQRLYPLDAVDVKSVAWCIMWGIAVGKGRTSYWQNQQLGTPLNPAIADPTPVMTEAARRLGMEVFASIRMNDTHDAFGKPHGRLDYPLKLEHPEWLLGDESRKGDFHTAPEALMWSGLDFEILQVRDDRLQWIQRSAERYDVHGVDLNFFRMPWLFRRGRETHGTPLMTDLVRKARRILDDVSDAKGMPVLLGVRVPGTVETCARVGIDVETWLREDLVDRLLVGGGYEPYTSPYEELVRLGHDHEVPVYPCINCGLPELGSDAAFRGAASNIYQAGGDGIYLWNYQYRNAPRIGYGRPQPAVYELLRELASPQALARGDKLFGVESADRVGPYAIASHPTQLPIDLGDRALKVVRSLRLRIGDDLDAAHRDGRLDRALLTLALDGIQPGDSIAVQWNGARLSRPGEPVSTPGGGSLAPSPLAGEGWDEGDAVSGGSLAPSPLAGEGWDEGDAVSGGSLAPSPLAGEGWDEGVSVADNGPMQMHWDVPADAVKPGNNTLTVWLDQRSPEARDAVTLSEAWLKATYK